MPLDGAGVDDPSIWRPEAAAPYRRSTWRPTWNIAIPAAMLLLIGFSCFLLPLILSIPEPVGGNVLEATRPTFTEGHFLGTDLNGNDVLSRLLFGGRASLRIAVAVNLIGLLVGGALGAFGAYVGGLADSLIMRIFDVLIAFPSLVLVVAIAQAAGPSELNTIWALAFFSVPAFARVARAATLRLREQPFVAAATLSGSSRLRVLTGHVAPNILPQLVTLALLGMGISIILEGALSYLGLGVPAPAPSWGSMIAHGQQAVVTRPMLLVFPSAFLFATVLSFNLLGDALRERWNAL